MSELQGLSNSNTLNVTKVCWTNIISGRAMAQVVSCRSLNAEDRVHPPGQSMRDLWWKKWHWDRFSSAFFFSFSLQYHSTVGLRTHIWSVWWTIDPSVAAVQRCSLNPSTWTTTNTYLEHNVHLISSRKFLS